MRGANANHKISKSSSFRSIPPRSIDTILHNFPAFECKREDGPRAITCHQQICMHRASLVSSILSICQRMLSPSTRLVGRGVRAADGWTAPRNENKPSSCSCSSGFCDPCVGVALSARIRLSAMCTPFVCFSADSYDANEWISA